MNETPVILETRDGLIIRAGLAGAGVVIERKDGKRVAVIDVRDALIDIHLHEAGWNVLTRDQ